MTAFIIVLILSMAAGCGIGGGGLLVVYMTLALSFEQNAAQATNLLLFIVSAVSSAVVQMKDKALPQMKVILFCSLAAFPGALLGTFLRGHFSERGLRVFFGYVLVFAGAGVLLKLIRAKLSDAGKLK